MATRSRAWAIAVLAALSCGGSACAYEFDREWIDEPAAPTGAGRDPTPVAYADAGIDPTLADPPSSGASADAGTADQQPPATSTGTWTCEQLEDCYAVCNEQPASDEACYEICYVHGSPTAQQLSAAISICIDSAWEQQCQSPCVAWDSEDCWTCIDRACAAQFDACYGSAA